MESVSMSTMVGGLISLFKQVEAHISSANIKDQVASQLQSDLEFLPGVIMGILPCVSAGNKNLQRDFLGVLQIICKALEEARSAFDHHLLSTVQFLKARSLRKRLTEAREQIKQALDLYDACCKSRRVLRPSTEEKVSKQTFSTLWDSLQELQKPLSEPCPRKILKQVARLRMNIDMRTLKWLQTKPVTEEQLQHFCRVGGLEALTQLLSSPSPGVQIGAITQLHELASNYDIKSRITLIPGAMEKLASLITSTSEDVQHSAVAIMRTLKQNNGNLDARHIFLPELLPSLLLLLKNSSPHVQANAASILWEVSIVPSNRVAIASAMTGTLGHLVRLFKSPSASLQFCAGAILFNLCIESHIRKEVSEASGAPERLTRLLSSIDPNSSPSLIVGKSRSTGSPTAGMIGWAVGMLDSPCELHHLGALGILQQCPENSTNLQIAASEGLVMRLVHLLHSKSAIVHERATNALYHISIPKENEQIIASQVGAVERLLELVGSSYPEVQESAVKVLESISFSPSVRSRLAQLDGSIATISALLFLDSASVQASAASLLWNISNTVDNENKLRIGNQPRILHRLVDLMGSTCDLVQEKAAGALMNLSCHHQNCLQISAIDATFDLLVALLTSTSTLVHQNAAGAICNLSATRSSVPWIAHVANTVPNLVALLASSSVLVQRYAAGALANLARADVELRQQMRLAGAVPLLESLRNSPCARVIAHANYTLYHIQ
ncbi:hypothetical protein O6H91_02G106100 [Diphasiastrum complanatum]|uniref:Uncharacterized protein n=3 Tax=Diphasiastrum complanatum TaxID=34168 RepID=A0ACC2EJG4_DIPCM|nr:hypothetical protein O6H91_02G106100 [Diphasiastrum complanatum]